MTMPISTGGPEGGGSACGAPVYATTRGTQQPMPASGGGIRVPSSFGAENTTFDDFKARSFLQSERVRMLSRRESYYRCIAQGERIVMADGGELPIEDVLPGTSVQAIVGWKHAPSMLAADAVRTGRKDVLELLTRSGRVLRATRDHLLLAAVDAAFGWVRAERLQPGDHLATPRFLAPGDSSEWSVEQAAMLGYLVGDGHCRRGGLGFAQSESEGVARRFDELANGLGGLVTWKGPRARVSGVPLLRLVERAGLVNRLSHEKRVPVSLFACSPEIIAAFLAALWDCDGSVNDHIGLALHSTTSERLARDVQSLLLRLGVWSRITRRENERGYGVRDLFLVETTGTDVRSFGRVIGPLLAHEEKSRRAAAWEARLAGKNTTTDIVPAAWRGLLSGRNQHRRFAASPSGNVMRSTLERIAELDDNGELNSLATSDVRWDRIESVEAKGESWVYDLTVPGADSFVASNCYVHNCTHHDWKMYDFDGRMIQPGPPPTQPLLSADMSASYYVPLKLRRPSAPYRLARVIVNSFTSLLFGYGRWPTLRVHGDPKTEDFMRALARSAKLRTLMIRARNIGGSVGTTGLSWCFYEGQPVVQVHSGKHLYVHEWKDRERLLPAHVSECYLFPNDEYDPKKRAYVQKWYWFRRDWTPDADIAFKPVEFEASHDPHWEPDEEQSAEHNDGQTHFIWIQNLPEDDGASIDGQPDYAELYENFDSLDLLKSVVVRGATLNLDPTLVLKLDPDIVARTGIKKGSDNSLVVGESGDAHYMELGGSSIQTGVDLFGKMREVALEVAQCVIPDPNQIGGAGTSSVALKVIYEPMLAKAELLREQYGEGMVRLLEQMTNVARTRSQTSVTITDEETGEETEVQQVVTLPKAVEIVTKEDGTEETVEREREPGDGGETELDWGEYFNPTGDDKQKASTTVGAAAGQKVMSQQTAVEEVAAMHGRDPRVEWKRVQGEREQDLAKQAEMFAGAGGQVAAPGELPPGAEGAEPLAPDGEALPYEREPGKPLVASAAGAAAEPQQTAKIELTGTDIAKIVTVNEGRASLGRGPMMKLDGTPDPDGELTIAEFEAKRSARGTAEGKEVGQAKGQKEAEKIAPPPPPEAPPAGPPGPGGLPPEIPQTGPGEPPGGPPPPPLGV